MASPAVRELRRVMFIVAQQLTQQESDTLVWMQDVPVQFKGKPPLTVLAQMESQGLFSASKPERFADILKDINRLDLAKQVTKITKRKKNQRDAVEQSEEQLQITLAANLEVTLLQSKILLEQVERLRQVVIEANEKRIGEIVGGAKESAERLKRTLEHASGLCRSKVDSITTSEEAHRPLHEPGSIASTIRDSAPTPSSPMPTRSSPVPPKLASTRSPLTSKQTKSTQNSGIYEVPCCTHNVTENQDKKHKDASHYYSKVTQSEDSTAAQLVSGVSANRPQTAPKPRPKRRTTTTSTYGWPADANTTYNKPQSSSTMPSIRRVSFPVRQHPDSKFSDSKLSDTEAYASSLPSRSSVFDDNSDYSSTYSGDDSGFADSTQFLRRPLNKRRTRVLPDLPPQEPTSHSNYYKSLSKCEDVRYYKTLEEREAVEDVTYDSCDTYECMASYKIPREQLLPEEPNSKEHIYMNFLPHRK